MWRGFYRFAASVKAIDYKDTLFAESGNRQSQSQVSQLRQVKQNRQERQKRQGVRTFYPFCLFCVLFAFLRKELARGFTAPRNCSVTVSRSARSDSSRQRRGCRAEYSGSSS